MKGTEKEKYPQLFSYSPNFHKNKKPPPSISWGDFQVRSLSPPWDLHTCVPLQMSPTAERCSRLAEKGSTGSGPLCEMGTQLLQRAAPWRCEQGAVPRLGKPPPMLLTDHQCLTRCCAAYPNERLCNYWQINDKTFSRSLLILPRAPSGSV